jgi:hypothetical protein
LGTHKQAVLVLRWLFDDARMSQLARDNDTGVSTAYDYRDEAISVLADRKPSLHGVLLAAKGGRAQPRARGRHVDLPLTGSPPRVRPVGWTGGGRGSTATTAATSRSSPPRTAGRCGPPTCARAASTTTAARANPDLLTQIAAWVHDGRLGLADLGYEGEADLLRTPAASACRRPSDPAAADGS